MTNSQTRKRLKVLSFELKCFLKLNHKERRVDGLHERNKHDFVEEVVRKVFLLWSANHRDK